MRKKAAFTLIEVMVAVAILGVLLSLSVPSIQRYRARSRQSEARTELSHIYGAEGSFKETTGTYHMNFPEIGFVPLNADPLNLSLMTNFSLERRYALSAGGPININIDDPKPVTFGSLKITVVRPDPKRYAGYIGVNQAQSCNIAVADTYGAAGGATPTVTQGPARFLATAKGCPMNYKNNDFDTWSINQDRIITQHNNGID